VQTACITKKFNITITKLKAQLEKNLLPKITLIAGVDDRVAIHADDDIKQPTLFMAPDYSGAHCLPTCDHFTKYL